jgi:NTE family protein
MHFNIFHKKKNICLVLGGGSARGVAHIGVLSVLKRENIPISSIVGTSMGALIGAAYSLGIPIKEMEEKAYKFSVNKLLDPTIPKMGLLAGERLEGKIRDLVNSKGFEECKIPLSIVTTDIQTGEEIIFRSGDLVKIVRASCSWPGIFNPVAIDGRLLSDGGIKNSVPTRIARQDGADYIIAVDVGFCVRKAKIGNIFQMILQSFQITGEELNKYQSREAEVVIKIDLGDIDQVSFDRAREAIEKGAEATELQVGRIKKDIGL